MRLAKLPLLLFFPRLSPPRFKIGLAGTGGFYGSAACIDLPGEFWNFQIDLRVRLDEVFLVAKRPAIGSRSQLAFGGRPSIRRSRSTSTFGLVEAAASFMRSISSRSALSFARPFSVLAAWIGVRPPRAGFHELRRQRVLKESLGDRLAAFAKPEVKVHPAHEKAVREPAWLPRTESSFEAGDRFLQLPSVFFEAPDLLPVHRHDRQDLQIIVIGGPGP